MGKDPESPTSTAITNSSSIKSETTPLLEAVEKESSSNKRNSHHYHPKTTILEDAADTFKLGVPIFIAMLSWVGVRKHWCLIFFCFPSFSN